MSWLERNIAQFGEGIGTDIQRYLQTMGVVKALHTVCGPFGTRRFLIHFHEKGSGIGISEIESIPLQFGGGAPAIQTGEPIKILERSLRKLYEHMAHSMPWKHGVLGCVRDCDNQYQFFPFFDEDAEQISLAQLPMPPIGHPLESNEYLRLKDSLQAQIYPVAERTQSLAAEWSVWEIEGEELFLIFGNPERPDAVEKKRCKVLGTIDAEGFWEWQVKEPLFSETIFCWENFISDWEAAMELAVFTTARLGGDWLFVSLVGDGNMSLFVAVWDQ